MGELVKAATVELTKLFETRYRAFVHSAERRRDEPRGDPGGLRGAGGKPASCSVGVQVNASPCGAAELSGPLDSGGRAEGSNSDEEKEVSTTGGCPTEEETEESESESGAAKEVMCHTKDAIHYDLQRKGSSLSSPAKPKPVKQEAGSKVVTRGRVKLPKQESLESQVGIPEHVHPEPQLTNVRPAMGLQACSPSQSDGAVVSALPLVEAWECVSPAKENMQNDLQMKLKRAGRPDRSVRPCSVRLVNIEAAAKSMAVHHTTGSLSSSTSSPPSSSSHPPLKDLRRHQGLHTGHRLCCYTACSNGVWRLRDVVPYTRDGYPCATCDKSFKRRKILRRHERFHTGERPYACAHCDKTFALRKSLRRHQRFHTGERPHNCVQCGKSFHLRENLKAHLRFHSGEKPYACLACGKTFRIAHNREKHSGGECGLLVPSFRRIAGYGGKPERKAP